MSALALVAGRLAPGVWRSDSTARPEVAALAAGLGWSVRSGTIETEDKADYLRRLAEIAEAPSYVQPNWDSVADGLRDLTFERRCLILVETQRPNPLDTTAIEVLDEAAVFWARQAKVLQVIWFGASSAPALGEVDPTRASRLGRVARTERMLDR